MSLERLLILDRRPLPVSTLYFGTIIILLIAWLPTLWGAHVGDPALDVLFLVCSLLMLWRYGIKRGALLAGQIFWIGYLATGLLIAVLLRGVHPFDFAQAYKFVWYLIFLAPFAWSQGSMKPSDFGKILNVALLMFFCVYLCKRAIGIERPILMTENNFEIIFLALLYYSVHVAGCKISPLQTFTLLAVVVLSGSRSAAIAVALAVVLSFDFKTKNSAKLIGGLIAGTIGVGLAFLVFESRSQGGIESIDRFRFFLLFLDSISDWGILDYLLGSDRLTPLPSYVCAQLAYYGSLFSYDATGSCYSVILHGFNLRIIYDHGFIIAALVVIYLLLLTRSASFTQRACLLGIVFISGLSVSALNNVYTALGIGIFCLSASVSGRNQS